MHHKWAEGDVFHKHHPKWVMFAEKHHPSGVHHACKHHLYEWCLHRRIIPTKTGLSSSSSSLGVLITQNDDECMVSALCRENESVWSSVLTLRDQTDSFRGIVLTPCTNHRSEWWFYDNTDFWCWMLRHHVIYSIYSSKMEVIVLGGLVGSAPGVESLNAGSNSMFGFF